MTKSSQRSTAINRSYSGYSSRSLMMIRRMYDENQKHDRQKQMDLSHSTLSGAVAQYTK